MLIFSSNRIEIEENEGQSSEVESSCMSDEEGEAVDEIVYKVNDEDALNSSKPYFSILPHHIY
jgi:hypothetical protein